jgi:Prolyl oligopeptidase family
MADAYRLIAPLLLTALLAACGNSGNSDEGSGDTSPPPPPPASGRGSLIVSPPARLSSYAPSQLLAMTDVGSAAEKLLDFIADPVCSVDVHQLRYNTLDTAGQSITASGAMMLPAGTDATCQGARPIVVYAHGTNAERSFNIANIADPDSSEGLLIALAFAAHGYIVVAPNYAGYDTSSLTWHPYLNAQQQAGDTADALAAARSALLTSFAPTVTDSGKLFITGYSEGGYVAMATQRLLQQNGTPVTASAPMSGPYALGAFGDAVFQGEIIGSAQYFVGWLATSYQRAYGNIYATPADMFDARYAPTIESLLPTAASQSAIYDQGELPRDQLFSSTPPDPAFAAYTPATSPADLAFIFATGFGPDALILNSYRLNYLQDAQAHPDGGFPVRTDGLPSASPANGLRQAFKANDLRTWVPTAPTLLCAGDEDPTVLYMNTRLMQQYWADNGATTVTVLDVDDGDISLDDPYVKLKAGFAAAKEAVDLSGGATAVADAYHSSLVPPFCLAAVTSYFSDR